MRQPTHRSERRLAAQVTVYAEIREDGESQFFADVGGAWEGGVFIATYAAVPINAVVAVELTVPWAPERMIRTSGQVKWRREANGATPGVGVHMTGLSDDERRLIEEFCRSRPPLVHEAPAEDEIPIVLHRRIG